jgi:signal transduction histidine kinase
MKTIILNRVFLSCVVSAFAQTSTRDSLWAFLLNVVNNAFYAVNEKLKTENGKFDPYVSVQTKKLNGKTEIIVKDNGNGIPPKALDKIFPPFFTTKPAGEGTGLGLSLAYDIVKAHGGTIKAETREQEGSTFIITLPF